MRILIVIHDLSVIENILHFAAQIVCSVEELPTILITTTKSDTASLRSHIDTVLTEACKRVPISISQIKIRAGRPARNILCEIEEGCYDLVLIGNRPKHWLAQLFQVSLATRIAECASCPVIIVKGKIGPIQHVLMCDNGSERPPLLARSTAQLVKLLPFAKEVTILHIMSQLSAGPGVQGEQLRADATELIRKYTPEGKLPTRDIQALSGSRIITFPKGRHGLVVDEILKEVHSGDYDLVVIGSYSNDGWGRFLLDNLMHKIVTQMACPVLVVR